MKDLKQTIARLRENYALHAPYMSVDFNSVQTMMQVITELERRLEVIKKALAGINGFGQHDEDCRINDWQGIPECTCGYAYAAIHAQEALATLNGE